jgi:ubiquinone/menaquinone biosynthesis C-methylase UbiE
VAGGLSNREAWDQHAEAWIAWARAEEHDHFFWRFSMPALLELAPAPGRLTLDVASGEGRMARALRDAGHTVLAIESSPTLVRAARKADPRMEVLRADVTRLPMGTEIADLAVCSMALMDFDDLDGALREIARVLAPGGLLVLVDSLQLGDAPDYDALLEHFPDAFHEPYYASYIREDLAALFGEAGFRMEASDPAYFSKVTAFRRG